MAKDTPGDGGRTPDKPEVPHIELVIEGLDSAETVPPPATSVPSAGDPRDEPPAAGAPGEGRKRGDVKSSVIINLAAAKAKFWMSEEGEHYATIPVGEWKDGNLIAGHWENVPLGHSRFEEFLVEEFYFAQGSAPGSQNIVDAVRICKVMARNSGEVHRTYVRVGELDGELWIDLGDPEWRAIRVRPKEWTIEAAAPVKFRRGATMRPLPTPERDDRLLEELLWPLVNVGTQADFMLLVGWLVGAFRPDGPYMMLAVDGPQGAAKSSLSRIARYFVDPSGVELRSAPASEYDLMVSANNNWVQAFDNQSELAGSLSDALCRLATGSGLSQRALYTNKDEVWFNAARPIILNGIPGVGSRADLADRCIMLTLPQIEDDQRRDEHALRREREDKAGAIFGAVLNALSWAVSDYENVPAPPTRMADSARWIEAAAPGLGWERGQFTQIYQDNRKGANATVIEADVVARAVVVLMEKRDGEMWEGAPSELMSALEEIVSAWSSGSVILSSKSWPVPNRLKPRLRRAQEPLRREGIVLDLDERPNGKRIFRIRRVDVER